MRSQGGAQAGRGKLLCEVELPRAGRAREHLFVLHENDRRDESCQAAGRWGASCGGREGAVVRWARL